MNYCVEKRKRKGDPKKKEKYEKSSYPRRSPNYFFAVQIKEPRIKGVMQAVQDHITDQNNLLKNVVESTKLAHLTVGLLHLSDRESVDRAVAMLRNCSETLQKIVSQQNFSLQLKGLGHFNRQVVYAKVSPDEGESILRKLAEFLAEKFIEFKSSSPFQYTPHLTLLKLSRIRRNPRLRNQIRHVETELYQHITNIDFGVQRVTSLQLLRMSGKDSNGYYYCESEVPLGEMEAVREMSSEEKYAEYLTSYIFASATCANSKEAYQKDVMDNLTLSGNQQNVGVVADATVASAMDEALKEVGKMDTNFLSQ